MIFKPKQLGSASIDKEALEIDKKKCKKFGPCGVGEKAVYLNSFYLDRIYYVPFDSITRIFKRVAMSKGGFTGKGIFATLSYLVVEYDNGLQKQCIFKHEEHVDQLLAYVESRHPEIKIHSEDAERRLAEKEKKKASKKSVKISEEAERNVHILEKAVSYLKKEPGFHMELSSAARKKRTYDRSNPSYKWVALFITVIGVAVTAYGVYAILTHKGYAIYFLLFGLAAIFLFSGARVLPTAKNNRKYVENRLEEAIRAMEDYIGDYPDFPVPAYYAHPGVLNWMMDILIEGRAENLDEALEILKSDLKALNASVSVEQEEFDEIMAIKPMFLVMDYK